jgi:cytoskeletal protein RodZ
VSIGESLAEARRRAGLTTSQVSQETRIREAIIRGIEQDDFSQCGGDFYARGHIRSIAAVVGTDPVPLISEYDAEHGPLGALRAADVFEPSTPIKIRERRPPSLRMIVVLVLLAVIGYSAYHLISTHGKTHNPTATGATSSPPAPRPTPSPTPSPSVSPTPSLTDVVINVATGQEDCWVLLTKASDGSQIYMGTLPAGTTMTWTEQEAVNIRLGNPAAVVLTVDGQRQPINTVLPVTLSFGPGTSSTPPSSAPPSSAPPG